jgi:hypothetical protein
MKFGDFFLPKIARSDPRVRIQAVNECKDVELLKRVIENDRDDSVKQVAKTRIATISASRS